MMTQTVQHREDLPDRQSLAVPESGETHQTVQNVHARLRLWRAAWQYLVEHPLTAFIGIGYAPMNYLKPRSLEYFKDLLFVLTQKEIKIRYKSSWLGYAWSIAHPLAFALIYAVALGIFMRVQIPNYPLFLIVGLFPWQWLANSINVSPHIFLQNTTLIKKVQFPRNILVVSLVLNELFHFIASIPIILLFLLLYGFRPSWTWLVGIPILVLAQMLLIYGIALSIASLNLFFRDLERLTGLFVTFLFFLTPIVYSVSMVPAEYRAIIYLNPVAPLFLSWQQLFLSGTFEGSLVWTTYLYALIAVGLGTWLYRNLSCKFAEVV